MRRALAKALPFVLVVLAGCGADDKDTAPRYPIPGCESFDTSPCDITTPACQTRLFELAACLHGVEPGDMPPVTLMSENDFRSYLAAEAAAQQPMPNQDRWDAANEVLGLVAPGGLDTATEIDDTVKAVGGFYDDQTKTVHVIDHGADSTPETSCPVLLHEFVHSLQDREVDLTSFRQMHDATYDADLASDAVIEGEAQFQAQRYMASMLGLDPKSVDWARFYAEGIASAEEQIAQAPSPLTATPNSYPYAWGSRYISLGWAATGHSGVLDLFAEPPADTQREMASVVARTDDVAGPPIAAPAAPAQLTFVGDDALGALGAFELLARSEDASAESIVLDWRSDHLWIYAGTNAAELPSTTVVWACDFKTAGSAAGAARHVFGGQTEARAVGSRLVVAGADDGSSVDWAFDALLSP